VTRRSHLPSLRSFAALLLLLAGAWPAAAQDQRAQDVRWPTPPTAWWEQLEPGWEATYEIHQGDQVQFRQVIKIEAVDGSEVTIKVTMFAGEMPMEPVTITQDLADAQGDLTSGLPDTAAVTRVGQEELVVSGQTFECTIYDVEVDGVTIRAWHCPGLAPLFTAGNVKVETEQMGRDCTITLVGYTGGLLEPDE
jgi:hypothetical protein